MISIPDKAWTAIKFAYLRITLTRASSLLFLLSFAYCFAQGLMQSLLYTTDAAPSALASALLKTAHVPARAEFAWLTRGHASNGTETFTVQLCDHIPYGSSAASCQTVYETAQFVSKDLRRSLPRAASQVERRSLLLRGRSDASAQIAPVHAEDGSNGIIGVDLTLPGASSPVFLNTQCAQVLVYADQVLNNAKREDLALVGAQFWLFIVVLHGIVHESTPHIIAALFTRVLATGWSAYAIWRTEDIRVRFGALLSAPTGACGAVDLFPGYFQTRTAFEIPDLVLNCTALLLSAALSWRLVKAFNRETLQRVCPTPDVLRIHRFFMATYVSLQLSLFFLATAMGLWMDQLMNSALAAVSTHTTIYRAEFIFTSIILLPWLILGWHALANEKRRLTHLFLALAFVLATSWALMFYSRVYRWTFVQWPFFGCMTVAGFLVIVAAALCAAVCLRGFGRGFGHHVHISNELAKVDFEPELFSRNSASSLKDVEKGYHLSADSEFYLPALPTLAYGRY